VSEAPTLQMPAVTEEAEPMPLSSSRYSIIYGRTTRGR
jgi:hypothetical protein